MTTNGFDIAFFGLALLSAVLGAWRGMVREIGSIFIWLIALGCGYFSAPYVAKSINPYIENQVVSLLIGGALVFVFIFVVFSVVLSYAGRSVDDGRARYLDKSLGFCFGIFRAIFIMTIIYVFSVWIWGVALPKSIETAKTRPFFNEMSRYFIDLLPDQLEGQSAEIFNQKAIDPVLNDLKSLSFENTEGQTAGQGIAEATGFAWVASQIDHLIAFVKESFQLKSVE